MVIERNGDMLKLAPMGALIGIPVNVQGVAGRGLAAWMKLSKPETFKLYAKMCRRGCVASGPLVTNREGKFELAMLPTKYDWREDSDKDLIRITLNRLRVHMRDNFIDEVHIPRLGCGVRTGMLDYDTEVKPLIHEAFDEINYRIYVYDWN